MDCNKVGKLISGLRKEKRLTQKQLADTMNISDRTISKWERGLGCPDVSLLQELSKALGVNIDKILSGDLEPKDADGGNMKRMKFYMPGLREHPDIDRRGRTVMLRKKAYRTDPKAG